MEKINEKLMKLTNCFEEKEFSTREIIMIILIAFLTGSLLGILFSPKKQTTIGSHNSHNGSYNGLECDDDLVLEDDGEE